MSNKQIQYEYKLSYELAKISTQYGPNTFVIGNAAVVVRKNACSMFILNQQILDTWISSDDFASIIEKFKIVGAHSLILHHFVPLLNKPIYSIVGNQLYLSNEQWSITIKNGSICTCHIIPKEQTITTTIELSNPNAIQNVCSILQ